MNASLLIKNGLILDPTNRTEDILDLRITDGDIVDVGKNLPEIPGQPMMDASGLWISPGFIDLHTHLRDFGQSEREDIDTGTMAAASGGFTTVLAMANTDPPVDGTAMLSLFLHKIEDRAHIQVLPVACVTRDMKGTELTNMVALAEMGAVAFSDDGMPISNLAMLRRALEYAILADRPIISHAEDKDLSHGGSMNEGIVSTKLGLRGIPTAAETASIAREIEVARFTGGRLHFAHVSCAASVVLIRQAQEAGIAITADVTPHHLSLNQEDIVDFDTAYKMNPPLRTAADQEALVGGLTDGTLTAIATDHAPHTRLDKSRPFDQAPVGTIGLETALPVTLEKLVLSGRMTKLAYIATLTTRPASAFGLPRPGFEAGSTADLAIIHPEHAWVYDAAKGHSKSRNSAFHGRKLTGKCVLTLYNGKIVFKETALTTPRLSGSVLSF